MDHGPLHKNISLYFTGIWALYMVLSTVYIFPKGMPQPADVILLAGVVPGLVWQFLQSNGKISSLYVVGASFAALTLMINLAHFIALPHDRFIKSAMYYPYNFLVFCFVVFLFRQNPQQLIKITIAALGVAALLQLIWGGLFDPASRATGGFQNPNQLAYWALLSAGILFFLRPNQQFSWVDLGILGALVFIQSLSLSKAGIICSFILLGAVFFSKQISPAMKLSTIGVIVVGVLWLIAFMGGVEQFTQQIEAIQRVIERLSTIGLERDDSLIGRGYDRLWMHPEYLIFGAGEGGYERFANLGGARELHSGLATILFSYGILGLTLFITFLVMIFRRQPLICWVILGCILLFSLPHQAFRFTHFWVFLGIAYASFTSLRTRI